MVYAPANKAWEPMARMPYIQEYEPIIFDKNQEHDLEKRGSSFRTYNLRISSICVDINDWGSGNSAYHIGEISNGKYSASFTITRAKNENIVFPISDECKSAISEQFLEDAEYICGELGRDKEELSLPAAGGFAVPLPFDYDLTLEDFLSASKSFSVPHAKLVVGTLNTSQGDIEIEYEFPVPEYSYADNRDGIMDFRISATDVSNDNYYLEMVWESGRSRIAYQSNDYSGDYAEEVAEAVSKKLEELLGEYKKNLKNVLVYFHDMCSRHFHSQKPKQALHYRLVRKKPISHTYDSVYANQTFGDESIFDSITTTPWHFDADKARAYMDYEFTRNEIMISFRVYDDGQEIECLTEKSPDKAYERECFEFLENRASEMRDDIYAYSFIIDNAPDAKSSTDNRDIHMVDLPNEMAHLCRNTSPEGVQIAILGFRWYYYPERQQPECRVIVEVQNEYTYPSALFLMPYGSKHCYLEKTEPDGLTRKDIRTLQDIIDEHFDEWAAPMTEMRSYY